MKLLTRHFEVAQVELLQSPDDKEYHMGKVIPFETVRNPCHQGHSHAMSLAKHCHVCDRHMQRLLQETRVVQTLDSHCLGSVAGSAIDQLMAGDQLFNPSVALFPHIEKWAITVSNSWAVVWIELIYTNNLRQCLVYKNHQKSIHPFIVLNIFLKLSNLVLKSSKLQIISVTNKTRI